MVAAMTMAVLLAASNAVAPPLPAARPAPSSMDFNLLSPTAPQAQGDGSRSVAEAVRIRRKSLIFHQGFGIATALAMIGTVAFGQLNYTDKFGGGTNTGRYELVHDSFATASVLTFLAAGTLALLAPVPFAKESHGIDTITVHKLAMAFATVGMIAEIVLGILAASREGYVNQTQWGTAHLIVGYSSATALTTGVVALFFQ